MLLVVDVGNTHTVIGMFAGDKLKASWRISTDRDKTADEYLIIIRDFLDTKKLSFKDIDGLAIASVVPSATTSFKELAVNALGLDPLVIDIESASLLPVRFAHPEQIGADRLANSFAGMKLYGFPLIIVDFGTAITFDIIDASGSYLGGIIVPGIQIAAEALFARAALLSKVDLSQPAPLIGVDTAGGVRSGIINGYASLVDGLTKKIKTELGLDVKVVATGGMVRLIKDSTTTIDEVRDDLTLVGISMLFNENRQRTNPG